VREKKREERIQPGKHRRLKSPFRGENPGGRYYEKENRHIVEKGQKTKGGGPGDAKKEGLTRKGREHRQGGKSVLKIFIPGKKNKVTKVQDRR